MIRQQFGIKQPEEGSTIDENNDGSLLIDERNVVLAPMVRGSELAFRQVVRRHGVSRCYSPMLRAEEVVQAYNLYKQSLLSLNNSSSDKDANLKEQGRIPTGIPHEDGLLLLMDILPDPEPLVVQLCGNDPNMLRRAVGALLDLHFSTTVPCQIFGIDLNLGCPQRCAQIGNFGAFLAEKNPLAALSCIRAMRETIDEATSSADADLATKPIVPELSCKIRLLDTNEQTVTFAKKLVHAGCTTIAVHCRRRVDKSEGLPNFLAGQHLVEELKKDEKTSHASIIINGGIVSVHDAKKALGVTKASGAMIASGFLVNPRLMEDAKIVQKDKDCFDPAVLAAEYLESCEAFPPVTPLYIQKHLRWIFRPYLEPKHKTKECFKDWRPRLWTFLVRPYLTTLPQFKQVVALYVKLNESKMPQFLENEPDPSFKSIKQLQKQAHGKQNQDDITPNNKAALPVAAEDPTVENNSVITGTAKKRRVC